MWSCAQSKGYCPFIVPGFTVLLTAPPSEPRDIQLKGDGFI